VVDMGPGINLVDQGKLF
jgi:CheY-like chemotaxis protein